MSLPLRLAGVAGFVLLTALCARIAVPMVPAPMTLQTFAVLLAGAVLRGGWGAAEAGAAMDDQSLPRAQPPVHGVGDAAIVFDVGGQAVVGDREVVEADAVTLAGRGLVGQAERRRLFGFEQADDVVDHAVTESGDLFVEGFAAVRLAGHAEPAGRVETNPVDFHRGLFWRGEPGLAMRCTRARSPRTRRRELCHIPGGDVRSRGGRGYRSDGC